MESYAPPPRTDILIAATHGVEDRLGRILNRHRLTFATSAQEVMSLLARERFAMVILSVHFDESQMFSLLGDIRGHGKYRRVPIVCVLADRGRLSEIAVEGLDHAVKAMTANGFLDLQRFPDNDIGNTRIRRIIDYLILIDGDLQSISELHDLGSVTERRQAAR